MTLSTPSPSTTDASDYSLCADLLTAVDALSRRRADQLDEGMVDRFVSKGWLHWHGGALRLTPAGARICDAVLLAYA